MYAKNKGEHLPRKLLLEVITDAENIEKLKALSKLSPVFDMTSHGTNVQVNIERKGVLKKAASGVPCLRRASFAEVATKAESGFASTR